MLTEDEVYKISSILLMRLRWHVGDRVYKTPDFEVDTEFGEIRIAKGFGWDGPSGWTYDTDNSMRASLIHDVLYHCLRDGVLPMRVRGGADREFRVILKSDGMSFIRRWGWFFALRLGGRSAARH